MERGASGEAGSAAAGAAAAATVGAAAALPPVRDVLGALTAASCGEAFSSEAAELVGDAVLDYLVVVHLFHTLRWGGAG